MNMNRKSNRALSSLNTVAAAAPPSQSPSPSPVVRHLADGVIRRATRGDRDAVAQVARELHAQLVDHAEQHMARFDIEPEDVVENIYVALLERSLVEPPRAVCALTWLLDRVALFAQPDLVA